MGCAGALHFVRILAAQSMLDTPRGLTDDGILRGELREGWMMDGSRLEYLEGRVEEQSRNWERLFADVGRVDQKIDTLGVALSTRIDGVDQKIDVLGGALSSRIDGGLTGLRGELATQFHWTIGIMTALFTAVLGAVLAR